LYCASIAAITVADNCLDRPAKAQRLAVRLDFHEHLLSRRRRTA
jgi:hypothetical protein